MNNKLKIIIPIAIIAIFVLIIGGCAIKANNDRFTTFITVEGKTYTADEWQDLVAEKGDKKMTQEYVGKKIEINGDLLYRHSSNWISIVDKNGEKQDILANPMDYFEGDICVEDIANKAESPELKGHKMKVTGVISGFSGSRTYLISSNYPKVSGMKTGEITFSL